MDSKNTLNIGKIRNYDNFVGEIVTNDGVYLFANENISDKESLKVEDTVMFRGEEIQGVKKAFFVKKLSLDKNIDEQVSLKLKK